MKRAIWRLLVAVVLLGGCLGDKRVVVDDGGLTLERDLMIIEAEENTRQMEAEKGSAN
jgi:hypothetical protein